MQSIDIFELREHFTRRKILLCFNGPISRSLIEEIGNALKNYLQADNAHPSDAMDVFSVYVEDAKYPSLCGRAEVRRRR